MSSYSLRWLKPPGAREDVPAYPDGSERSRSPDEVATHVALLRRLSLCLIVSGIGIAVLLAAALHVRVDPRGTSLFNLLVALLLYGSQHLLKRQGNYRIADAAGTVAVAGLGGLVGGALAMLALRLHFPLADERLQSWDHALGIDGIAILQGLADQGHWIFGILAAAYNNTLYIFFGGLIVLSLCGDRVEAWRGAFCFVGTLLTTCLLAIPAPAKGLAVWAHPMLLAQLPIDAMRSFWPHFDQFYFGSNPVLRLQVIDGVIAFPSFHAIVGFLILAMWRKRLATLIPALVYLALMLLATFPGGGHYFVDLLGGFVVWAGWFALSKYLERRHDGPARALVTA